MFAEEMTVILSTIASFVFVVVVLGLVVYALVRPVTHHDEPGSGKWVHLP